MMPALRLTVLAWLLLSALAHASGSCNAESMEGCFPGAAIDESTKSRTMLQKTVGTHNLAETEDKFLPVPDIIRIVQDPKGYVKDVATNELNKLLKDAVPKDVLKTIKSLQDVWTMLDQVLAVVSPNSTATQLLADVQMKINEVKQKVIEETDKLKGAIKAQINNIGLMQVNTDDVRDDIVRTLQKIEDGVLKQADNVIAQWLNHIDEMAKIGQRAISMAKLLSPADKQKEIQKIRDAFLKSIISARKDGKFSQEAVHQIRDVLNKVLNLAQKIPR